MKHIVYGPGGYDPNKPNNNIISEEIVEDPPFAISKLSLRRALRSMGLEAALNKMLASDPTVQADWDDAPHLMSDDPILQAMIPAAAQLLGIPEAQVVAILEASKIE